MKNLRIFDKFIFILNSLAAVALLLSYLLPHIPPKTFPLLSVLSLGVPVLILLNILFLIYWILRLKKQLLLSLIVLILGYNYVTRLVAFNSEDTEEDPDFSIMSYNVRMFNAFNWTKRKDIPENIVAFVKEKNPDVVCMQEYFLGEASLKELYPYEYIVKKASGSEFGSAIFSKFPIIKKASLDFPQDGNNNAIYTDLIIKKDTIRIFNVHFQSLNIKPGIDELQKEDSRKLLGRIGEGFSMQQDQAEAMLPEIKRSPYRTMIVGDFNNTSFSYNYTLLKSEGNFQDAFLKAGNGFGQSFKLNYFPLRIDFMLIEEKMRILNFEKYDIDYSDHYPILSRIKL